MLSAVAFVSTFESPGSSIDANAHLLKLRGDDFIRVADAMPSTGACNGKTVLDQLAIEGMNGDDSLWKERVDQYFGPGIDTAMYLDNLRALYLLHGNGALIGESSDILYMPDFTGVKVLPVKPVSGAEPLDFYAPAIRRAELQRLQGDALKTTIKTAGLLGEQNHTTWSAIALLSNSSGGYLGRGGVGSLTWANQAGVPMLAQGLDVTQTTILPPDNKTLPILFKLMMRAVGEGTEDESVGTARIPVHASVQIDLPAGWENEPQDNLPWVAEPAVVGESGTKLIFTASAPILNSSTLTLSFRPPDSPDHPFDVLRARAFNGSFSESSLVIRYDAVPLSHDLPRSVYPTTPYALRSGETVFFGAVLANGGDETTVTSVDLEVPGGYDIWMNHGRGPELFNMTGTFESADGHNASGSWSLVDSRHVRWTATTPVTVPASSAQWWGVWARATSLRDQSTSVESNVGMGPMVNVTLANGYQANGSHWGKSPGIIEVRVPGGAYNATPPTTLQARVGTRTAYLFTTGSYDIGVGADLLNIDNALQNSSFEVNKRMVPVGGVLQADADVESIVNELGELGVSDASLTLDLYAPPHFGCKPTASWSMSTLALPRPPVTTMALYDVAGAGAPDLFVGTADTKLYRLAPGGIPTWSLLLHAAPTALAYWDDGPADRAILVGDEAGYLYRLTAATGDLEWEQCVAALACEGQLLPGASRNVTSIATRTSSGQIAVATLDGKLATLVPSSGLTINSVTNSSFTQIEFGLDGSIYANRLTHAIERFDGSLQLQAQVDGDWFAYARIQDAEQTQNIIRAASKAEMRTLDATSLQWSAGVSVGPIIMAAVSGDANGDGYPELVLSKDDYGLVIYDGKNGTSTWVPPPPMRSGPKGWDTTPNRASPQHACLLTDWGQPPICPIPEGQTTPDEPPLLSIGEAGILEAYNARGAAQYLRVLDSTGNAVHGDSLIEPTHVALVLASGRWGPANAAIVGHDDGAVEAHSDADVITTTTPSTRAGKFTFQTPVPLGGFYGTHILIVTLQWQDTHGITQAARLADWFELVDATGEPVTNPGYRASIIIGDRSDTLTSAWR